MVARDVSKVVETGGELGLSLNVSISVNLFHMMASL